MRLDTILQGDALATLRTLPDGCVQCCVTSPPYWGLRDYGVPGQLGLERTPEEYVARMVEVFREVRRVLRDDGTCWINLGDSYSSATKGDSRTPEQFARSDRLNRAKDPDKAHAFLRFEGEGVRRVQTGLKPKDLIGIPWMVAFALRADGWYLRADCIWHKPNPMPESVRDRPTKAHEYVFLLAKRERYYYDADAIAETSLRAGEVVKLTPKSLGKFQAAGVGELPHGNGLKDSITVTATRNKRSVWTVATAPYAGAHFATFPPALVEPCVLAGAPPGGIVLDPFFGSGTVGAVCRRHSRHYLGIELNPAYIALAEQRIADEVQPVLWTA